MIVWNTFDDIPGCFCHSVIALGMFDGLHIGHQKVIMTAKSLANKYNLPLAVMTFSNHPLSIINPDISPLLINDISERHELFENFGVEYLLETAFDHDLMKIEPDDFVKRVHDCFSPSFIVVGPNYSFGNNGKGTPELICNIGEKYGIKVIVCEPVSFDGEMVSSTRIRKALLEGNIEEVNHCLGRGYSITGVVSHGDERGRAIGYPTANINLDDKKAIPVDGAYASKVFADGKCYAGMANIGTNPTFGNAARRLEVHLLDYEGNLYGRTIKVSFIKLLRHEVRFSSIDELVGQLKRDELATCRILKSLHESMPE
ncbi:MAG: bifunctional riboflavin kinase/FAD synthetase [Schwartzia sp.]|nr:bifunctional riboflavin kinase/FAD synthetase [Schwartzia sp. (in: firmicutes)]